MLQIKEIRKKYVTGDLVQTALDGVSLTLRDNEFVAILGPSGSGKTTLLNVIGGLDRYDSGDLVINGISTEKYSDRDWDSYRNHTIGFVFQSYNLIPHQTVLANVELALTISGISRSERKKRAKKALEDVGLGEQLHKKPNQMSGGQMQRVAIARALVNNPDILLADEPTGALDTETSIQVMDLLREVSKDRLVVMVTHNPELAEAYANRIVRVRDGKIIDDTNPYSVEDNEEDPPKHKNMGKASMSFFTALSLSFNNLRTKLGRTLLTAFAGSIGIIGIALILSLSTGFQNYIDQIQEDTLANYPLSLQQETADMGAALLALGTAMNSAAPEESEAVVEQPLISQMFSQVGKNDLAAFKKYLEENMAQVEKDINAVKYSYGIKPLIYSANTEKILQVNPGSLFGGITGSSMMSAYMDSDVFYEMIDNVDMLDSQYDVLVGRWPENAHEVILVLAEPHRIPDYIAYTLGLKDSSDLKEMISQLMKGEKAEASSEALEWTYEELMTLTFRCVPATQKFRYNEEYAVWEDMSADEAYMKGVIDAGMLINVVGIVCPKDGANATTLSTGIAYTSMLTHYVIEQAEGEQIVVDQLSEPEIDVFTGKRFDEETEESSLNFQDMISVDEQMLSGAFDMDIDERTIMALMESYMKDVADSLEIDTQPAQNDFIDTFSVLAQQMLLEYIANNKEADSEDAVIRLADAEGIVDSYLATAYAVSVMESLEKEYMLPADTMKPVYRPLLLGIITAYVAENWEGADLLPEPSVPEDTTEPTDEETEIAPQTEGDVTEDTPVIQIPDDYWELMYAKISEDDVERFVEAYLQSSLVTGTAGVMAGKMMEADLQKILAKELAGFSNVLMRYFGNAISVDEEMLAGAFQFNMNEEELRRLMEAMSGNQTERSADSNLRSLGYAEIDSPNSISIYFVDFEAKENFLQFLDGYNQKMTDEGREEQVIGYTDITGIMMSSVRTIIDSVSYVLIAFVAVSLVVSSIMIGIITYISVMERTKEIGVLRAIGASKRNISQVFNAETFIIGLCSGLIGVGVSLLLIIPINQIIYALTDNPGIKAQLPLMSSLILVLLSMGLTIIGGLIPAKHAAKKDPVIALRSE